MKVVAQADPICQLLMSAPGVGYIAALTFKAAIDNPARFRRSKTVAAHFGLTPRRYQSGERDNPGRISKADDVEVRSALFLAANTIMNGRGQPSSLRSFGARLARRKGRETRDGRCCPQTCRCAPSHVHRWHPVLQRGEGGARLTM